MKKKLTVIYILILGLLLCSCTQELKREAHYERSLYKVSNENEAFYSDTEWVKFVYKEKDKDFVVLNLTDIQLNQVQYLNDFDEISKIITKLVEETKPDLITLTGDYSFGHKISLSGIFSFINSFGIPWAPVYGNHDFEDSGMSINTCSKMLKHFSNCLFADGPSGLAYYKKYPALGNYVINVVEKDGENSKIVKSLILFNTGLGGITDLQQLWVQDCTESVDCTCALFMHIPVYAFKEAANAAYVDPKNVTLEESYTNSPLVWKPGYEDSFGINKEEIEPLTDEGLMNRLDERTNLVVAGHDHINCAVIKHKGVTYCFGLKTGPGSYFYPNMCGGTKIALKTDGTFTIEHIFEESSITYHIGML